MNDRGRILAVYGGMLAIGVVALAIFGGVFAAGIMLIGAIVLFLAALAVLPA